MHIKIYFGDKPVYLCDDIDKELHEILHHPDAVFVDEISNAAIKSLLHEMVKEEFHAGVLWHSDLEKLKKAFFKNFTPRFIVCVCVVGDKTASGKLRFTLSIASRSKSLAAPYVKRTWMPFFMHVVQIDC